ncbi:MAG: class I mannose-6-phosphate isomerase [Bacteroidales bacterium]|jgi:mannose-6-phosphate isomerase|nr:class I mannose-6-phosphate isomerase [Bacteroidales bacterium]
MDKLYPLKFKPVVKDKIWGGNSLSAFYNKRQNALPNIGESWEISAVEGNLSVVANGFLAGNNIEEIIEVYMGDITGDAIYEKFGVEFPLLVKFIEARENLSVQVHPGNEMAKKRHSAYGKTEMWYIVEHAPDARIYSGFKEGVSKEVYSEAVKNGSVTGLLNVEDAAKGDVFFIPAGRIHAIGAGTVLVEIQQTSDITYRISDWDRAGKRELHTALALDALDFSETSARKKINATPAMNVFSNLVDCDFFTVNLLKFDGKVSKNYYFNDSFVIYICIDGELTVSANRSSERMIKGDTLLLPAALKEAVLEPSAGAQILEVYVNSESSI